MGSSSYKMKLLAASSLLVLPALASALTYTNCRTDEGSLHDFELTTLDGSRVVPLSEYAGKATLLINVASWWGIAVQYPSFNALIESFDGSVDIIGVPCDQFLNQEPGSPEEIMKTLEFVRPGGGFKPAFTLFEKSHVNDVDRIPLYQWALNLCDAPDSAFFEKGAYMFNMFTSNDVRWNFEKILFDKNGKPVKRYGPITTIEEILPDIEAVLQM